MCYLIHTMSENVFLSKKNILFVKDKNLFEIDELLNNFCGTVTNDPEVVRENNNDETNLYLVGGIDLFPDLNPKNVFIVSHIKGGYDYMKKYGYKIVDRSQVPRNIHNVGVYFQNFLPNETDYFKDLTDCHKFQQLKEGDKEGFSYRKGIYLTDVNKSGDGLRFHLMRCSTNLNGPTDSLCETDKLIINTINDIHKPFFSKKANFNHVLAQVYNNHKVGAKEKKAKIKAHSDKTKDMPSDGLMAFVTFYDKKIPKQDDHLLSSLRFKLKDCVKDDLLKKDFNVVLHHNSVFIMSLEMNRLYTHETVSSVYPIDKIPTRLGYVVRCSKTMAVCRDGVNYIENETGLHKLEPITEEDVKKIKDLYYKENVTDELIEYGDIYCSMNKGDYLPPNLV